jgi:hypothetical protein
MQKLDPICASKDDFALFIAANEGVVADAFERKKKYLAMNFCEDKDLELDSLDSKTALEAIMEISDRMETLLNVMPAQEAARANDIIDKYLNSDRTKMVDHYRDRLKEANTASEVNGLISEIQGDLDKMEDFVDGKCTVEAFVRWMVTFWTAFTGTYLFGIFGATGSILVGMERYQNVDRIREKTKSLIPYMKKCLSDAQAKYKKLAKK